MTAPSITPRELYDRLRDGGASVLDVRDRDEYDAWRVDGAGATTEHVPYMEFVSAGVTGDPASLVPDDLEEPVVAVCAVGEASDEVADDLREAGVDAVNLAGGMEAWADLLVAHDVDCEAATVVQFERPATGCLSYLVASDGRAALVDPLRAFVDDYLDYLDDRGLALDYAVDTHVHADHVSGVRDLADRTGADAVLPEGATERGLAFDATLVADGDALRVGDAAVGVTHAPGHTTELVVLDVGGVSFTADCLFLDGVGRPDLEDPEQAREHAGRLYDTLTREVLPRSGDTTVAPGHLRQETVEGPGPYVDSLAAVRERVGVGDLSRADFVDRVARDLPARPANHERIVAANLGREALDDLDVELGPNNCVASTAD